jgi:hypothetical protein
MNLHGLSFQVSATAAAGPSCSHGPRLRVEATRSLDDVNISVG